MASGAEREGEDIRQITELGPTMVAKWPVAR